MARSRRRAKASPQRWTTCGSVAIAAQAPIATTFAGFNGESFDAKLWGVARLRHNDFFSPGMVIEHPADKFGDAGAAMGAMLVALAAKSLTSGTRSGPALVWAASDREPRACAVMSVSANYRRRGENSWLTVFANSRGVAHKGSGGMSPIFPDVCKTPTPSRADSDPLSQHREVSRYVVWAHVRQERRRDADDQRCELHDVDRRRSRFGARRHEQQDQGSVRVHDVLVRRQVRGEERLPAGRSACFTTKRMQWAEHFCRIGSKRPSRGDSRLDAHRRLACRT